MGDCPLVRCGDPREAMRSCGHGPATVTDERLREAARRASQVLLGLIRDVVLVQDLQDTGRLHDRLTLAETVWDEQCLPAFAPGPFTSPTIHAMRAALSEWALGGGQ